MLIKEDGNAISVLESMIVSISFEIHLFYQTIKIRTDYIACGGQVIPSIRLRFSALKIVVVSFIVRVVVALVGIHVGNIILVDTG